MKRAILFFLLLSSFSFCSLVWQFNANGEVDNRPIVFSNSILIASTDGSINLLNPTSGSRIWEKKVLGTPVQPVIFQGKAAVATTNGKVALLGIDGSKQWETDLNTSQNVTFVYGLDVSTNMIYASTDMGIITITAAGTAAKIYNSSTIRTPPTVSGSSILFGDGDDLVKIGTAGNTEWKKDIGGVWRSKPVVEGSAVYIGGLDKKMHSLVLSNGAERWAAETGNWVLSSALVEDGTAYFGSNDGYVYAIGQNDGNIYWKTRGLLALQGKPESGMLGGTEAVFVSGTDGSVYAFDSESGDIIWRSPIAKWASDPLYYQDQIIFGSKDRTVSAYSTERACSIKTPTEAEIVGLKEVKTTGNAVSEAGSHTVEVQVNTGSFEKAILNGTEWAYYIDPSKSFVSGINTISCRVSDASGFESGKYTSVDFIYDPAIPKSGLIVTTSGSKLEGEPLAIYVNDGTDGSPVERFSLSLNGLTFNGSGFVNITAPSGGSYQLIASKIGYDDSIQKLDIYSKGISPMIILAVVAIIGIVAWQAYPRLIKKG